MRLNVSILVLAGAAVNGVVAAPVAIDNSDKNTSSHQLVRRSWYKFAIPTLKQIFGISAISSLFVVPGAYLTARRHEREYLERLIAERRREDYEKQMNRDRNNTSGDGEENDESETISSEAPRQSGGTGAQIQQGGEQSSGQSTSNQSGQQTEVTNPLPNFLPPTRPNESGVGNWGGSVPGGTDQRAVDPSSDTSSSTANPNEDPSADQGQSSPSESNSSTGQTSTTPVDERETREKSIEEILMEDNPN